MTYSFEIHYTFKVNGQHAGKGTGMVNAETAEAAEVAFRAEYPATERFDYTINNVIVSQAHFRRLDAQAAFAV